MQSNARFIYCPYSEINNSLKTVHLKKTADISFALGLHIWTNLTSLNVFAEFLHGYLLVID